jgi:hypothetical protein
LFDVGLVVLADGPELDLHGDKLAE